MEDKDICLLASTTDVGTAVPTSLYPSFLIRLFLLLLLLLFLPYSNWGRCPFIVHAGESSLGLALLSRMLPSSIPNYQDNPTLSALCCHITLSLGERSEGIRGVGWGGHGREEWRSTWSSDLWKIKRDVSASVATPRLPSCFIKQPF